MQLKIGIFLFAAILFFSVNRLMAQKQTIASEIKTPYPTIENIAIEWFIQGDTNNNGKVEVQFRQTGATVWQQAMPLRHVPAGSNNTSIGLERKIPGYTGFKWPNRHSGSIFHLTPNTSYEIRLVLTDPDGGDTEKVITEKTRPVPGVTASGSIIEIAAGRYDTLSTVSGTKEMPVVYRCSKGKAVYRFIDMRNRKWTYIEGLQVENRTKSGVGIDLSGSENCAVTHCVVNAVSGIIGYPSATTNCYISDNSITGTYKWTSDLLGAAAETSGEGIQITGPGNVICYNKVSGFRDCISLMEDEYAINQVCNDIYNNDIYRGLDDGIEADFCFSNCRIYDNRLTNCFVGLSSQPGLGGPTYFIRNVMYNIIHSGFKLKRYSQGDMVLHNTLVKIGVGLGGNSAMDHAFFRNNLAIGGRTGGIMWGGYGAGNSYGADVISPGSNSDFDYDAVGVNDTTYIAKIGERSFADVETHGIENITMANTFNGVEFTDPPIPEKNPPDLTLKTGSRAIDAGMLLPNINDGFTGKAPDCGAYEKGLPIPHYGPREKSAFHIAQADNPEFIPNTKFSSFEDLSSTKFEALKNKFQLDTIFHGEQDEFKRILLLRDWIKKTIRIDNVGPFPGDESAESILEEALKGHGFHCAHFSLVQEAVMNAYGYVTRYLRADDCDPVNGEGHHAINEIWLNRYHKWFMSDSKYNYHFEKNGIPLSALEIRAEYLNNKAADIKMVKGADRTLLEFDPAMNNRSKELFARIFTWISWSRDNDIYTHWPHNSSKLIVFNDEYFRTHVWMRDGKPHWAYHTIYFDSVTNKEIIEWTPNTISASTSIDGDTALISLHSDTPNFKTFQMRTPEDTIWTNSPATVKLNLRDNNNRISFRTMNTAGVSGPAYHLNLTR